MTTTYKETVKRLDELGDLINGEGDDARRCQANGMLALAYSIALLADMLVDNDGLNITTHQNVYRHWW